MRYITKVWNEEKAVTQIGWQNKEIILCLAVDKKVDISILKFEEKQDMSEEFGEDVSDSNDTIEGKVIQATSTEFAINGWDLGKFKASNRLSNDHC